MKKILFVIESLHCGGAEKSLITLLQNLRFRNGEVIELMLFSKGGEFEKFVPDDIKIKYVEALCNVKGMRFFLLKLYFFVLKKISFKNKYHSAQLFWKVYGNDILRNGDVYDYAIAYNQGFSTYYVAEKIKANTKYAWLNTDYKKAGYNIEFDYDKYKKFKKIITVSEECNNSFRTELARVKKDIPTEIIVDITDVEAVKRMVRLEEKLMLKESDECVSIVSVGRLSKYKGFDIAIKACLLLKNKGYKVKWYIIGEGAERELLEKLISLYDLKNNFFLLGYKDNPYPYIKECDIYCQTSLFEGLCLTLIEASMLNKPIVTTNFPTSYTILKDMYTGVIVEMNENSLAQGLEKIIEDEEFKDFLVLNLVKSKKNIGKEKSLESFYKLID